MKAKKIAEIKRQFCFEAQALPAAIPAGLSSFDSIETESIDLNQFLAPQKNGVYLVRVNGESMIDENIFDGDYLVVDGKESPGDGKIVIASLDGQTTVKTLKKVNGKFNLYSANKKFLPIEIEDYMKFEIQGVVKHVIHSLT